MKKDIILIISMIFIFSAFLNAENDLIIEPTITYLTPTSQTGGISLDISGGEAPYTYEWKHNNAENLPDITSTISGLEKGAYRVTVTDVNGTSATAKYNLYYSGVWDSAEGLNVDGNVYSKIEGNTPVFGSIISNNIYNGSGGWKFFEFDIYDVESETIIGFVSENTMPSSAADIFYGFRLLPGTNGSPASFVTLGGAPLQGTFSEGTNRIRVTINVLQSKVAYYYNGLWIGVVNTGNLSQMNVGMLLKEGAGVSLDWNTSLKYDDIELNGSYAKLRKKLDGAFVETFNDSFFNSAGEIVTSQEVYLRFKYTSKYNIVIGENDVAKCTIYNWKRENMTANGLPYYSKGNSYGTNWQEIDVTHLNTGEFYTLEVTGINKDEKYYLRFRR